MSYTIFTSNPTALIAQPGRAVNTFPSGLVRVDQTYIGKTSHAAAHRAALAVGNNMPDGDSSPCIDGLKIFPEAQEIRREDGFTEYKVSAYGRVNTTGNKTFSKELGLQIFSAGFVSQSGTPETLRTWQVEVTCDFLIWKFVSAKTSSPDVRISDNLKIFRLNGNELNEVQISEFYSTQFIAGLNKPTSVSFSTPEKITLAEAVNFGSYDEWTVVHKATPAPVALPGGQRTGTPSKPNNYDPIINADQVAEANHYFYLDMESNGAVQLTLVSVENIDSPDFSWNSSTPKTNIPLDNTEINTYLGGTARIEPATLRFYYSKPTIIRPQDIQITNGSQPTGPSQITIGHFLFNRYLKYNFGDMQTYSWKLQPINEVFEINFKNENNQIGGYVIAILFSDPE